MSSGNVYLTTTYYDEYFPTSLYSPPLDVGSGEILYQVASSLVYANSNNANLYVPSLNVYFKYNNVTKGNSIFRNINTDCSLNFSVYNTLYYNGDSYTNEKQIINNYPYYNNIHFKDFPFGDYLNFDVCYNLILNTFSPNTTDISYIVTKYPYMLDLSFNACGLCVYNFRDTDSYLNTIYFNYLQNSAMKLFNYLISKGITIFVVFTNDLTFMNLALSTIIGSNYPGITIYKPFEQDYMNLWMMSMIPVSVASHSFVSWWGAYLNKNPNKIVYYSSFLDPLNASINKLPTWIVPVIP
jgi:hypothetical protein